MDSALYKNDMCVLSCLNKYLCSGVCFSLFNKLHALLCIGPYKSSNSGNCLIAEATMDTFWDAGLIPAQIKHTEPNFFRGKNVLGSMLYELIFELRSELSIPKSTDLSLIVQASSPASPLLSSAPPQSPPPPMPFDTSNQSTTSSVIPVDNTDKSDTTAISTKFNDTKNNHSKSYSKVTKEKKHTIDKPISSYFSAVHIKNENVHPHRIKVHLLLEHQVL